MNPFHALGKMVTEALDTLGGLAILLVSSVRWGVRPPYRIRLVIEQMAAIGVGSLPVVIMTGLFTGMVLAYQSSYALSQFGLQEMAGLIVSLGMARELGPVLSSIMVTARSGSAMTAELGTMKVTEQIDALYALAVEPVQYLVVPRVIAGTLMMPLLNIISVIFGIIGGYIAGVKFLGINSYLYLKNSFDYLGMIDIFNGSVKAAVFGLILAVVGCYKGMYTSGGALGVGKATTESVVASCVLILLFDYVLTALMW